LDVLSAVWDGIELDGWAADPRKGSRGAVPVHFRGAHVSQLVWSSAIGFDLDMVLDTTRIKLNSD
jgi:hypothetical protein